MEVKLPSTYRDKGDNVSYTAINRSGTEQKRTKDVCFYHIISHLGEYEITCRPWDGDNSSPRQPFQRFFRELTRCGLVPEGVRAGTLRARNVLVVPRRGWGYHPVFIALSLYRHADCHGRSILGRTMKLYRELHEDGVHFLQCLHWSLINTNHRIWHSCFNLRTPSASPYERYPDRSKNLKYGIALATYGKMSLAEKNALVGSNSTLMFDNLAKELKDLEISCEDEILNPEYAKYYEDPEKARKG